MGCLTENKRRTWRNTTGRSRHDNMVVLVERMLALHQKLAAATVPTDKQLYQRPAMKNTRTGDQYKE